MSALGKCENAAYKLKDAIETHDLLTGQKIQPEQFKKIMGSHAKPVRHPMDYVNSFAINSMLSGIASTGFANAASVLLKMAHGYIDTVTESGIQKLFGKDRYTLAEINAAYKAAAMNLPLMYKMGRRGWEKGYPLDIDISMTQMAKATGKSRRQVTEDLKEGLIQDAISRLTKQGRSVEEATVAAREMYRNERDVMDAVQGLFNEHYDYMQNVWTDFADHPAAQYLKHINIPTQATVAIDEFGKTFFRMFEANKMLARQAVNQTKGNPEQFADVFNGYVERMTKNKAGVKYADMENFDDAEYLTDFRQTLEDITGDAGAYAKAKEYALREMFQSQLTGMPRSFHEKIGKHSSAGTRLLVPFIKTPWNIGKQAISYTPAGIVIKKVAGKGKTKLNSRGVEVPDDEFRGAFYDYTEDEMIARAAVGTAMMGTLAMLVDTDSITGAPRDARESQYMQDRGIPPRSIQIGDMWVPYGRVEPLATVFGLVADAKRLHQEYQDGVKDWDTTQNLMNGIAVSLKQNIMQKTFFESFTSMLAGVTDTAGSPTESMVSGIARMAVPTVVAQTARALDDAERMAGQGGTTFSRIQERMMQRIPLLREQLPEEIGLFGPRGEPSITESYLSMKFVDEADLTPVQRLAREVGITKTRSGADWRGLDLPAEWISQYRKETADNVNRMLTPLTNSAAFNALPKERRKKIAEDAIERAKKGPRNKLKAKVLKDPEYRRRYLINEKVKKGVPLD